MPYAVFNVLDFHTGLIQGRGNTNSRFLNLLTIGSFWLLQVTMWHYQGRISPKQTKLVTFPSSHCLMLWSELGRYIKCYLIIFVWWPNNIKRTNQQTPIARLIPWKKYFIWVIYCGALSTCNNFQIVNQSSRIHSSKLTMENKKIEVISDVTVELSGSHSSQS